MTMQSRPLKDGNVEKKTYHLEALPKYLILFMKRFHMNMYVKEKNRTIVHFPIKNLDLSECTCYYYVLQLDCKAPSASYDLVANIIHEGKVDATGAYKIHIYHRVCV